MSKVKTFVFITFGQDHMHILKGIQKEYIHIDKDTIAAIPSETEREGREIAFKLFGPKFCTSYFGETESVVSMNFFPKGITELTGNEEVIF
jgi:hypothetical protein